MSRVLKEYTTIKEPYIYEQVIKKSRFYGRLFPATSMEEAQSKIEQCKKEFWDAAHNCSAVVLGAMGEFTRCSDDGEPQGTAGVPMLEALKKSGVTNVLAVVTRYFGGTLLGAGGLVRAYTSSVSEALKAALKVRYKPSVIFTVELPFKLWGRAEAQLIAAGHAIKEVRYGEGVTADIYADIGAEERLEKLLAELSAGAARPVQAGAEYRIIDL